MFVGIGNGFTGKMLPVLLLDTPKTNAWTLSGILLQLNSEIHCNPCVFVLFLGSRIL